MENGQLNWIANFIWGIADDVLRDVYVRGKYRDVILPMTVIRRLDAVLEPTKQAVLDMKAALDKARIVQPGRGAPAGRGTGVLQHLASSRCATSGPAPASSSSRPTSRPTSTASRRTSRRSWTTSSSATRSRASSKADVLGTLIEKFLRPGHQPQSQPRAERRRHVKHPAWTTTRMGTIFEELIRRFNEENNEEAGEHCTPRDVVQAHGQPDLPADRRPASSPAPTCSTTAPAAPAAC